MFDRVYLINLKRRQDRLAEFRQLQQDNGWNLPEPILFEAIDGNAVGVPTYFQQGGGAWGCCLSHREILQRVVMDGVSALILEDDLVWKPDAWERLQTFVKSVPNDWDQLMIGGQHMEAAKEIASGVVQCARTERTHAYAIRGRAAQSLLNLWFTCSVHIDWVMGPWQKSWKVYAPDPFIFGQNAGRSDISGNLNERKFWVSPDNAPVVVLDCPREVAEKLRGYGLHMGFTRDKEGYDAGLSALAESNNRDSELQRWLIVLSWEAASMENSYVTVWHPKIWYEHVAAVHQGETIRCRGNSVEECLDQLKTLKLKNKLYSSHCLLLQAPRHVAENLPGFHLGNWRDPVTGKDNGIREAEQMQGFLQIARLKQWFEDVTPEADKVESVPMIWSDVITEAVVKQSTTRTVITIMADSAEEVKRKWKAINQS